MRRTLTVTAAAMIAALTSAAPALACGGLIGPNGAVNLTRTTTFAAYADGVEHYVTAFNFAGGTGKFGSITPLPGVPTNIERGGDWTLQRLIRETEPVREFAAAAGAAESTSAAAAEAEVLIETTVDALDITVLKGSGDEVGRWAKKHGFRLPPDSPEVLDFYAKRSPIFMAAAFDADRAKAAGQQIGDGTPIHLTIPTDAPWVPLRILGLGKQPTERVEADILLLTERRPAMLPEPTAITSDERGIDLVGGADDRPPLSLTYDQRAGKQLLRDLHDDKSGEWVPLDGMWLSRIRLDDTAGALKYDLAIDPSGAGRPSIEAAGYTVNGLRPPVGTGVDSPSSAPVELPPTQAPAPAAARDVPAAAEGGNGSVGIVVLGVVASLALIAVIAVATRGRPQQTS